MLLQGYPRLEYYVMDGGSNDESPEILRKYAPWLTGWTSEKDAGQTDAIAKGFARTSAACIAWLNSDDLYLPGALSAVGEAWPDDGLTVLGGDVMNFTPDGRERRVRQCGITLENMVKYWEGRYRWHQPGLFFPRAAYDAIGGMDISLHYAMDHDLMCRLLIHGCTVAYLDVPVARFRLHDVSKTCSQGAAMSREISMVTQRFWPQAGVVDRSDHDAYHFGKMMRYAVNDLLHGQFGRARAFWREATGIPTLTPIKWPSALLRFLRLRRQRRQAGR